MHNSLKPALVCASLALGAAAHAAQPVLIGMMGPLTGGQAASGKDNENGARLAIQDLNARHLVIAGSPVSFRLESEDDQADPRIGMEVAQKIVDAGAVVMLGPNNSGVAIPVSKLLAGAGVPMVPVASNPDVTRQGLDNVFRIGASDSQIGGSMADFAANQLKLHTVAVIDDRTTYGEGVANEFEHRARQLGLNVVAHEYTNTNAVDFKGILSSIKSQHPDAIFYGGYITQAAALARQIKQLGLSAKLLGGDGFCMSELGKLAGAASDTVYCAQGGPSLTRSAAGRDFLKRYKQAYGIDVLVYAANFYDGMQIIAHAMQVAGTTTDRAKIRAELAKTDYQGIAGRYRFDANGNMLNAPATVYRYQGGQLLPY
ncbi:branched-chain amino acid ABC transporter substrate-binding protein [Burkholderia sp. A1]|uniref:branched-chain amino acid ABC transporter substrate-binding protein n=1 Tax=Burkholderia sp. A1 TaxID=148446 RepID=UPI0004685A42|nr:branched-chain amino acid ABC transporter substrate-binding protein [Burkholderia sp. A1]